VNGLEPELGEAALCERPRVADPNGEALLDDTDYSQQNRSQELGVGSGEHWVKATACAKGFRGGEQDRAYMMFRG
jgi:hypothetical protein